MYFNDQGNPGNPVSKRGLNPYCNGCTSMMGHHSGEMELVVWVSILIVMDVLQ